MIVLKSTLSGLMARRSEIVDKINRIGSMRKGVLNAKYQKVKHKNGEVAVKGPYYVLTKKAPGGKTISQAIPVNDVLHIQEEVSKYKCFRELADEYVDVCEEISIITERMGFEDEGKKNLTFRESSSSR
jgi:hypothetical protein